MRGLPSSGKSTKAKELVEQGGKTIRLNRDLLRKMLHFDKWTPRNEGTTIEAEEELAIAMLHLGYRVVIDDTNLPGKTLDRWAGIADNVKVDFEIIDMDVSVDECIKRDSTRTESVGKDVIINMALRNGLYKSSNPNVIFDVDGTLCDISGRKHLVADKSNKAWKEFFARIPEDKPREEVVSKLKEYWDKGYNVWLLSGRPEDYKKQTIEWMQKYEIPYTSLIMRRSGDKRPDTEVKKELFEKHFSGMEIEKIYDDRPVVVRQWVEMLGKDKVVDVGDGIEF